MYVISPTPSLQALNQTPAVDSFLCDDGTDGIRTTNLIRLKLSRPGTYELFHERPATGCVYTTRVHHAEQILDRLRTMAVRKEGAQQEAALIYIQLLFSLTYASQ